MTNLKTYAIDELARIGMYNSSDDMDVAMTEHILKMIDVFNEEEHSGFSAEYAIKILEKLLRRQPLSPLTGDDEEWIEPERGDNIYQNKRCSRVFKSGKDGQAYDIRGKVFVEPNGSAYTSRDSSVFIEFPYVPKTDYVSVNNETN
jgi:hypothetical protein